MDVRKKLQKVENSAVWPEIKIKKVDNIILDLINEVEAEEQNMHPETNHDLANELQQANETLQRVKVGVNETSTETICEQIINEAIIDNLGDSAEIEEIKDMCRVLKKVKAQ